MKIELSNIGKRFGREWIFKGLSYTLASSQRTGIIGANGSGKSTLLQLLTAAEAPTSGEIRFYSHSNKLIQPSELYQDLCFTAPYIDLPEDLTAIELIRFHQKFKSLSKPESIDQYLKKIALLDAGNKLIKHFSSGMKQRLKLGLAIGSEGNLLLLDEPCSHLDQLGVEVFHSLLDEYSENKLIVISSNEDKNELYKVDQKLSIDDYKRKNQS